MKKLLGVSALAMMLAACSSPTSNPEPAAQGAVPGPNPQMEAALKACAETVGQADQVKFDACMKEKGFEKPAQPAPNAATGAAPAGEQAAMAAEEPAEKTATAKKAKAKKSVKKAKKAAKK